MTTIMQANAPHAETGWTNTAARYGRMSRIFHWGMALLMVGLVGLGLYSASMEREDPVRESVLNIHKSFGLMLLVLVVLRILWHRHSRRPAKPDGLKPWESRLSGIVQTALYGIMLGMPLTGILLSQSAGHSVPFFGLFALPQIVSFDASAMPAQRPGVIAGAILHKKVLSWTLYALVALHVAGFAKHHFIDKKPEFLRRMWGR